ncbi:MAG TPA: tagaturonate epimerase family protein, partial [Verrucomicrobiae bacterium]|nr:tagaturonate epimerase family protein [Verrucomicrobiae bacterium]
EGLWVAGVLAALQDDQPLQYGADADHIQVKRGTEGMARAKRLINAARYYSFYTMDMADVLDYEALRETSTSRAEEQLIRHIPNEQERRGVLEFHGKTFRGGGKAYTLAAAEIGRFVGKYWNALAALTELANYIASLKDGGRFDLELTIDEHPPEIGAFACLTSDEEVLFLLREMQRRELTITHLAPNFGVEKGADYRCPDGLEGLEKRIRSQFSLAKEFGVMLDFHSGDDLTSAPRRVIQRATQGWHHFKISPMLQIIFAEVLHKFHPQLFERWWKDAYEYANTEAQQGSTFAKQCLTEYEAKSNPSPSHSDAVFHHYSFAFPGRRDPKGQFIQRHEFYQLSPAFYEAYQARLCEYLCQLAEELFNF